MTLDQFIIAMQAYKAKHPLNGQTEIAVLREGTVLLEFDAKIFQGINGQIMAFDPKEKGARYTLKEIKLQ